jgi:hypothetical protein
MRPGDGELRTAYALHERGRLAPYRFWSFLMRTLLSSLLALLVLVSATRASAETPSSEDGESNNEWISARTAPPKDDGKNVGLAADVLATVPVDGLADSTGPLVGASLRVGAYASPHVEGYLRVGYQRGLKKQVASILGAPINSALDDLPLLVGGRFYVLEPRAGLHADVELGARVLFTRADWGGVAAESDPVVRFGGGAGAGYVVSTKLPLDIGAQLTAFNLAEHIALGMTARVGYEARF